MIKRTLEDIIIDETNNIGDYKLHTELGIRLYEICEYNPSFRDLAVSYFTSSIQLMPDKTLNPEPHIYLKKAKIDRSKSIFHKPKK
jgi:hypothetical protein